MGFYAFVVLTDVGLFYLMQTGQAALDAERRRATALAESRELLFRELQHRVSNNLQMAAAIVGLQRKTISDPAAREILSDTAERLALIGRTSRSLYDPSGATAGLAALAGSVARDVRDACGRTDIDIRVAAETDPSVGADAAIPVALIVAEAVANAIEHGFADGARGAIDINISAGSDGDTLLAIRDNGRGLRDGFADQGAASLGLTVIGALSKQIGGRFTLSSPAEAPGAEARLVFDPSR